MLIVFPTVLRLFRLPAILVLSAALAACSSLYTDDRPEVQYSVAHSAAYLQVPPDLSAPEQSDLFVVSGADNGKIQRNTLLPDLDEVRFVREGSLSWLELSVGVEELWPLVRKFIERKGFLLQRDEPLEGYMQTTWAEEVVKVQQTGFASLFRSALMTIVPTSKLSSYQFRFERAAKSKTRLFITRRLLEESQIGAVGKDEVADFKWSEAGRDPELETRLLTSLMVYLGIDLQRAQGILSSEDVALLESTSYIVSNEQQEAALFVGKTVPVTWRGVGIALDELAFKVEQADRSSYRYEAVYAGRFLPEESAPLERERGLWGSIANFFAADDSVVGYTFYLAGAIGGTEITLSDINGERLQEAEELAILQALHQYFG